MRLAVLQPAGGGLAQDHYRDTVEQAVPLQNYASLLGADYGVLQARHPSGQAAMWGATPGKNGNNVAAAQRMSAGDYVLFAGDKRIFAGGTVTHTWHNTIVDEQRSASVFEVPCLGQRTAPASADARPTCGRTRQSASGGQRQASTQSAGWSRDCYAARSCREGWERAPCVVVKPCTMFVSL